MAINTSHEQTASYSPKTGSSMPLFTVTMRSGRTVTEKDAISAAIHEASVSVGYPEDDHFQRFISLQEADLRVSPLYPDLQKPRSEHVLMIEALLSSGTEEARKRSLLAAIVTRLQAAGTDPNDVMVFFGEIDRASSSFGGGRLAPACRGAAKNLKSREDELEA
jgi:phenylpyruvate tautomerase PptA (4-oxalocrotonate tautomerase family)